MKDNSYINSPIIKTNLFNKTIYIKRDDLLHEDFSGNKARKFYYYLINDFPNIKKVVSHGSSQSNAMYSLSVLCKLKKWKFDYYVNHLSTYLKENPNGNYKEALKNGMTIYEKDIPKNFDENTLFIKEGGAIKESQLGIKKLAQEIESWAKEEKIEDLKIVLPSGTGTTALYLQKFLPYQVLTCACVGDEEYLKKQFFELEKDNHPTILKRKKKYHYGKLYKEFFDIYKLVLEETRIEFDLLYDPVGLLVLQDYILSLRNNDTKILYIHQGGLLGNKTMLERYNRKY